jgi:formylglycine-generating enzyme required for sulfatase activity
MFRSGLMGKAFIRDRRQGGRAAQRIGLLAGLVTLGLALALPGTGSPADLELRVEVLKHESYTEHLVDGKIQLDMVAIPGGTFFMGSPDNEKGRSTDEGPQHPVRVRPFWMGKTEVTWDEYDVFWKHEPATWKDQRPPTNTGADAITRPSPPYIDETLGFGREEHPVVSITHHAAMEYCRWLSAKTGKAYRLPTEAEWEWAARAGTTSAFYFGDDPAKLGAYAWYDKNSDDSTYAVGRKKPNLWGLYDMYGNVAEWCLDHYQKDYYTTFPTDQLTLTPVKLPTADRYPHVARGGSWADGPDRCRSAARRGSDKSWNRLEPMRPTPVWWLSNGDFVGFRVVRAVEEQENLKGIRSKVTKESP